MTETRDNAGVIAPPPLIALAAVLLGLALDWLLPAYLLMVLLSLAGAHRALASSCIAAGAGLAIPADARLPLGRHRCGAVEAGDRAGDRRHLRLAAQSDVCRPGSASRRALHCARVRLDAGDDGVFAPVMHFGVVKREERYLEAKFGDAYRQYMARVPRYGWPG